MIRSFTVTNHNGQSLYFDLFHPEETGLYVKSIEGLGPPKASINSNEVATIDGGIFTSARMQQRNIVITLGMMWDPLIEDARLRVYQYFPIKKQIRIELHTDYRTAECTGYVESNTPDIFSNNETCQISILCPDPYFYELYQEEVLFAGVRPAFQFPFCNNSLTEKLLIFGEIREDNRTTINYRGDVDTGMEIVCHVMNGGVDNLTIWNVDTRENMRIDTNKIKRLTDIQYGMGDDIIINTKIGAKSINLLHDGKLYNIISCINKDADWFQLTTGPNTFTFVADHGANDLKLTLRYRNAYGGV